MSNWDKNLFIDHLREQCSREVAKVGVAIIEFTEKFANPYVAASNGTVDTVIDPAETRPMVIKALEMLSNKRDRQLPRKHGNMNL